MSVLSAKLSGMATTNDFHTPFGDMTYDEINSANATLASGREAVRLAQVAAAIARDEAGGIGLTAM